MNATDSSALPAKPTGELRLALAMNRLGMHRPVLRLFQGASRLGDGIFWYGLLAAMLVFDGRDGLPAVLHMSIAGLFVAALYRTMKNTIRRPRPFSQHRAIVAHVAPLDEFSFPSGHTLHAVTFAIIAVNYYPGLGWLLAPMTLAIAASRVILGVHYPSDVLAATGLGIVIAWASFALSG